MATTGEGGWVFITRVQLVDDRGSPQRTTSDETAGDRALQLRKSRLITKNPLVEFTWCRLFRCSLALQEINV